MMLDDLKMTMRDRIEKSERIMVVSHIRPDGDAVGSLLGLGLAIRSMGKQVQMVLEDGVPPSFRHLTSSDKVVKRPKGVFDLAIVVDCSDIDRTGSVLDEYGKPDINIDHHVTNLDFAAINYVIPEAVSTTQMLTDLIQYFGVELNQPIGEALLTGLITDTLGFRTVNMSPDAFRTAAVLMESGIDLNALYGKALIDRSFAAMRYWGTGLMKLNREDRMVWTTLTLEDRKSVGYPGRDDADLINILSSIKDADISIIFIEQSNQHTKVSWRARPGFDVSKIAFQFGGGGHKPAAGADISGSLEEVIEKVLEATRTLL